MHITDAIYSIWYFKFKFNISLLQCYGLEYIIEIYWVNQHNGWIYKCFHCFFSIWISCVKRKSKNKILNWTEYQINYQLNETRFLPDEFILLFYILFYNAFNFIKYILIFVRQRKQVNTCHEQTCVIGETHGLWSILWSSIHKKKSQTGLFFHDYVLPFLLYFIVLNLLHISLKAQQINVKTIIFKETHNNTNCLALSR